MKNERRVATYARISTSLKQSTEMQMRELREYCRNRGWEITEEFIDSGVSGAKDSRPQLDRMMADAHRRRFDIVVVWKFDRFARSVSHLLRALETFRSLDIEFVSLSEQVDTSTPTGKMVFTVLGAVAELERSLTGERVRAGLRNARAKGKRLGRPPLRELSAELVRRLKRDRWRERISFKGLAQKHGVSVWTAFQICRKAKG
jgi:DNA invertase Pin-like site-specific DNA recombinase